VAAGAQEIDIVISRRHALTGNWQALYDEMREMRAACGDAHVKAILGHRRTGRPCATSPAPRWSA
jgi:deoxyribose-phosphate aldolase